MTKESIIELQKLDCNCNDCKFMQRDIEKYNHSLKLHEQWSLDYFNSIKNNLINKAKDWREKGQFEKAELLEKEANNMIFQFNKKEIAIQYGICMKLQKEVSFIPNCLQLDTQHCFEHRKS